MHSRIIQLSTSPIAVEDRKCELSYDRTYEEWCDYYDDTEDLHDEFLENWCGFTEPEEDDEPKQVDELFDGAEFRRDGTFVIKPSWILDEVDRRLKKLIDEEYIGDGMTYFRKKQMLNSADCDLRFTYEGQVFTLPQLADEFLREDELVFYVGGVYDYHF